MKKLEDLLSSLHVELAEKLLAKLRSGDIAPSELNVIRQFLKDNGVDSADLSQGKGPMTDLAKLVPFKAPDEPIRKSGGE